MGNVLLPSTIILATALLSACEGGGSGENTESAKKALADNTRQALSLNELPEYTAVTFPDGRLDSDQAFAATLDLALFTRAAILGTYDGFHPVTFPAISGLRTPTEIGIVSSTSLPTGTWNLSLSNEADADANSVLKILGR